MKYINSYKYIEGDEDKEAYDNETLENSRKANCKYVLNNRRNRNTEFETYQAISVVAEEDIVANQELFLEYGDKYTFPASTNEDDPPGLQPKTPEPPVKELTKGPLTTNTPQINPETKSTHVEPETKTTPPVPDNPFDY